ncbi:MAG: polysaccharide biosynthesis protein, partial [Vibrionaceae bacterium]
VIDGLFIVFSFYSTYWVRVGSIELIDAPSITPVLLLVSGVTIVAFSQLGLYRAVLRYLTLEALAVVGLGTLISATTVALGAFYFEAPVPRSLPIIYGAFLCLLCGGSRLIVRSLVYRLNSKGRNVLIYGAGSAGRQLAVTLRNSENYNVVGFLDSDKTLENTVIMGITVYDVSKVAFLVNKHGVTLIMLAVPSASRARRKEILGSLMDLPAEVLTIPDLQDIVAGKASIGELKEVAIDDLLGRDPVAPQPCLMQANILDKVVMVTGAGGSIGSELCRQIVRNKPKTLVLFERSEFALYKIDRELEQLIETEGLKVEIIPLLGSVQRINRVVVTMKSFHVQTVYHAAAYKHVPLVEYNVVEGIRNNLFGTY